MTNIYDSEDSAPVVERIADVIVARLREANIYNATVARPDREGTNVSVADGSIVVHQKQINQNAALTCHGNPPAIAYDVRFELQCYVRNQNTEENAYSSACNKLGSQVIRAITQPINDPAMWYQMDGLAINTNNLGAMYPMVNNQGDRTGVIVPVLVTFRVSENNPYEVRG